MRVVTWHVWGRYGEWQDRQALLEDALAEAGPDIVCLVEAWSTGTEKQADVVAGRLGFDHAISVGGFDAGDCDSGIAILSRWPIILHEHRPLPGDASDPATIAGSALFAVIDAPRGPIQLFSVVLDYPLDGIARRQLQVRQLCEFVAEVARGRHVTFVCGDFNAGPDSEEIRMLTGRRATAAPGLVFHDSWEVAGDGTAGITWSNRNPLAATGRYPARRFDSILSAWPRAGAASHPVHCEVLGARPGDGAAQISDHYGVLADLRY